MRYLLFYSMIAFGLVACGRQEPAAAPPTLIGQAAKIPPTSALADRPAYTIVGRVVSADSGVTWAAGIMEFRATDPQVQIVASVPSGADGRFSIPFASYQWDIPYAVVAFRDANGNGQIDQGEDFVGGESHQGAYHGKNLFLISKAGTFVGDRPLDLEETEFLLDVASR